MFWLTLLEEMKVYRVGRTPSYDLLMGLMYMIPKTQKVVSRMRPISVGNTWLKWITTMLLIHIEDVLAQFVHPSQVGSLRGRQMQNHLWSLRSLCEVRPSYVAIGVDFVLALTSLSHVFISSLLKFFRLRANYIRLVMVVMKAPHKFMVGVPVVHGVICLPQ